MHTNIWNIKLFPKLIGSTANRSFLEIKMEIASFCSVRNSQDIPSSHKNLRDSSTLEFELEFAMFFFSHKNKTKEFGSWLTDNWQVGLSCTNQKLHSWVNRVSWKNNDFGQVWFFSPHPILNPSSCLSPTLLIELSSNSSLPLLENFKMVAKLLRLGTRSNKSALQAMGS